MGAFIKCHSNCPGDALKQDYRLKVKQTANEVAVVKQYSRRDELIQVAIDLFATHGYAGTSIRDIANTTGHSVSNVYHYFDYMVTQGLRGQLKSNILTGQSLIVLDIFTDVKDAKVEYKENYIIVPTVAESVTGLIKQINELLARLKAVPIESIGNNLIETTQNINKLINSLNAEEGGMTGMQINEALIELNRAARSIRAMSEYLERHPEALIKGKE